MKFKLFTAAAGIALLAVTVTAKAQKTYNEGLITYSVATPAGAADVKTYFKADSNCTVQQQGPATIKVLSAAKGDFLAILVDVPVAGWKKAAVATPAEIEEGQAALPEFTFTPGSETKQIAGFNCKKVAVKDAKGTSFDVWVTNDFTAPINGMSQLYSKVGGFPVEFTTYQMGQTLRVTFKSISDEKIPGGTFGVPAGYERISMADLRALGGKR